MKLIFLTTTLLISLNFTLLAHGMNKKGPHGGFIKMPGTFHTELVDRGDKIVVYLIDINFKNPITYNSNVFLTYKGQQSIDINCAEEKDYFVCYKPKEKFEYFQQIIIHSIRNKIKATEAVYGIPLRLD